MLKLGRLTKVKVLFLVLVFVFHFDLFKFSAAILEKGLFFPFNDCNVTFNNDFESFIIIHKVTYHEASRHITT